MAKAVKKPPMREKRHSDTRGKPITTSAVPAVNWKKSIRGICKDLVGHHSTEIAMRIREGMLNRNLRLALKYLTMVAAYESGKPVETHRMVALNDGPSGVYDLTKLDAAAQKQLLEMLRKAKDTTVSSGVA